MEMFIMTTMPKIVPVAMTPKDSVRRWRLIQTWTYRFKDITISVPRGFIFDGASIPRIFRRVYAPTGYLFLAALIHDFCYQRGYYYMVTQKVNKYNYKVKVSRAEADELFAKIATVEYPSHSIKTEVAYLALRVGGWIAWDKHRKINNIKE